jgi:hypothetical protein
MTKIMLITVCGYVLFNRNKHANFKDVVNLGECLDIAEVWTSWFILGIKDGSSLER